MGLRYNKYCYFDSYGCPPPPPPKKVLNFIKSKHGKSFYSEYHIRKIDSFSGSYVLYIIYSTKVLGIDFESSVLNLDYQMIQLH